METRSIKTLTFIVLIAAFIFNIAFAVNYFERINKVADKSKYADQEVNKRLLQRANEIEKGIHKRKSFTFTVEKDPLKQDIILPQRVDEIKLRLQKRYNDVRLYAVLKYGDKVMVGIEHKDIEAQYNIGDKIKKSWLSVKSADPATQTCVLSNGRKLKVKERMDVYNVQSKKDKK